MKASQQRKVVQRIAANGIVEVDEGGDFLRGAEDIPEREVLVDEAAALERQEAAVVFDFGGNLAALFR